MKKRVLTPTETTDSPAKCARLSKTFTPIKVATAEAAAAVEGPLFYFLFTKKDVVKNVQPIESVVYWMRMSDLRIRDNRALLWASQKAKQQGVPLIAIFILSPQDYIAHDIGARKVDFTLRSLASLKKSFSDMHIPFHVTVFSPRRMIPSFVLSFCKKYGAHSLFANTEYEVDEVRRDTELGKIASLHGVQVKLATNCILQHPVALCQKGKAAAAEHKRYCFGAFNREITNYSEGSPLPSPNNKDCRSSKRFAPLFDTPVPEELGGFKLEDDDKIKMFQLWPEGEDVALKILETFLSTMARPSQFEPTNTGAEKSDLSQILQHQKLRDRLDCDSTSRLGVYLSSGVISVGQCIRLTLQIFNLKKAEEGIQTKVERWFQAIVRRDFYTNTVAFYPRVSMGRPYHEKYSKVVWEDHRVPQESGRQGQAEDAEAFKRWKEGRTGVPIVDAAMRCINEMGWVHDQARKIAALYLTKHLMFDWHVGEQYFMQKLIDGDFASNNAEWQWCSGTGIDAAPYFRLFNLHSQSEKVDPNGEFIHYWVPELRSLNGRDLHNPPPSVAQAIGYPLPIIGINEARERVLRRFGKPGTE